MAVRRERDSARRAEVDPTRDGPAGGVVDDRRSDPVPCLLDGLDPDARRRGAAVPHEIAPPHVGQLAIPESDTEGRRRRGRDPHDGGRRPSVRRLSEAADVVGQEGLRGCRRQGEGVAGDPAIDGHAQIGLGRGFRDPATTGAEHQAHVGRVIDGDDDVTGAVGPDRMLVEQPEGHAAEGEARSGRPDLEPLDVHVRSGVRPREERPAEVAGKVGLGRAQPGVVPAAGEPGRQRVLAVPPRQERDLRPALRRGSRSRSARGRRCAPARRRRTGRRSPRPTRRRVRPRKRACPAGDGRRSATVRRGRPAPTRELTRRRRGLPGLRRRPMRQGDRSETAGRGTSTARPPRPTSGAGGIRRAPPSRRSIPPARC